MIFVSYSWKDHAVARELEAQLRERELEVWIDYRDLQVDEDILPQLDTAIRRCGVFVSVGPRNRTRSAWMKAELALAFVYAKAVVHFTTDSRTREGFDLRMQYFYSVIKSLIGPVTLPTCLDNVRERVQLPTPSRADIEMTQAIVAVARPLGKGADQDEA
jgi:hypothetical protein